jgi:hypothetical protein
VRRPACVAATVKPPACTRVGRRKVLPLARRTQLNRSSSRVLLSSSRKVELSPFLSRQELGVEGLPSPYTLRSQPNHRWESRYRPCSSVRNKASPPRRRASPGASPHGGAHARVLDQAVPFVHLSRARRTRPRCPDLPSPPRRASARPPSHTCRSLELATPTSTLNCSVAPPPTSPCLFSLPFGFPPSQNPKCSSNRFAPSLVSKQTTDLLL